MKILFLTGSQVSETKGGTERITLSVAQALTDRGHRCFSMFFHADATPLLPLFEDHLCFGRNRGEALLRQIHAFVKKHKIDVIVNQGDFGLQSRMAKVLQPEGVQMIMVLHFAPGWEENFLNFRSLLYTLIHPRWWGEWCRCAFQAVLYPWIKPLYNASVAKNYARAYQVSDQMVLLSEEFKEQFVRYAQIEDASKLRFIPNTLSFQEFFPMSEWEKKQKEVVIVSRLEEKQKRLSHALRIWQQVEQSSISQDWTLHIVGHGGSEREYQKLSQKLGLQRITFHGRQDPKKFYRRASIFMMTSRSEGWGLTLTESQQMGVVPMAYDSYASLHDIITDGYNGCIVPNADITSYAQRLLQLMGNDKLRHHLAVNAIESSHRFEAKKIGKEWEKLMLRQ